MQRWIALTCLAMLVIAVAVTVVDAGSQRDDEQRGVNRQSGINGVTPSPTAPATPTATPTSVATPIPG